MAKKELASGVCIDPFLPSTGAELCVEYSGTLANSSNLKLCVDYGTPPNDLTSHQEFGMRKQNQQWSTTISLSVPADTINFSFMDNKGSIDNNQGKYYSTAMNSDSLSYA